MLRDQDQARRRLVAFEGHRTANRWPIDAQQRDAIRERLRRRRECGEQSQQVDWPSVRVNGRRALAEAVSYARPGAAFGSDHSDGYSRHLDYHP